MERLFRNSRLVQQLLYAALVAVVVVAFVLALVDAPAAVLLLVAVAGAALGACGWVWVRRHFGEVDRLRGAVAVMAGDLSRTMPAVEESEAGMELAALHRSMSDLIGRVADERQTPDERLMDVVAAVGGGLVVMTESGLISLINDAAREILGSRGTECGTSIYDVFSRRSLAEAADGAAAGEPTEVWLDTVDGRSLPARFTPLARHGGAVIWMAETAGASRGAIELALDLHDRAPEVDFSGPETPLDDLPGIVIDTETTGLDVRRDRIISFGSVQVHGTHVYRAQTHDILINPLMPIPKRSIAVHGITDAMAGAAPEFSATWPEVRGVLSNRVVIGHNIGFDAAILTREAERLGELWRPSALIDTLLLAAALEPQRKDLTLEGLAAGYGIPISGRHTALGDALVTAQLYVRLVDSLKARGVATLAQANSLSGKRTDLVTAQEERGWLVAV